mmetsp:Transcript_64740/g.128004  ORF Transcript_64740/g.128004 Transcript_64740/m.128004 type:complete len:229 (+) Transcript_64740:884-1570(+)
MNTALVRASGCGGENSKREAITKFSSKLPLCTVEQLQGTHDGKDQPRVRLKPLIQHRSQLPGQRKVGTGAFRPRNAPRDFRVEAGKHLVQVQRVLNIHCQWQVYEQLRMRENYSFNLVGFPEGLAQLLLIFCRISAAAAAAEVNSLCSSSMHFRVKKPGNRSVPGSKLMFGGVCCLSNVSRHRGELIEVVSAFSNELVKLSISQSPTCAHGCCRPGLKNATHTVAPFR